MTTSLLFLQLLSVYMQVGSRATNLEMTAVVEEMEVRDRVCNDYRVERRNRRVPCTRKRERGQAMREASVSQG